MQSQINFYLKSTKHSNIIFFSNSIIELVKNLGGSVTFFNLPTQIKRISVYSSPHVYKKFKDHYEVRTFKRVLQVVLPQYNSEFITLLLKKKPFELSCKISLN